MCKCLNDVFRDERFWLVKSKADDRGRSMTSKFNCGRKFVKLDLKGVRIAIAIAKYSMILCRREN